MAHGWLRTIGLDNQPDGVAFRQRRELTASTACIITPPPLIRNIGEGRSGPQTVSAKTLYLQIRPSRYSITDLYIYTSCSAVAVIVVELRPGIGTIVMRTCIYTLAAVIDVLYKFYHKHQNIICVIMQSANNISIYLILIVSVVPQQ